MSATDIASRPRLSFAWGGLLRAAAILLLVLFELATIDLYFSFPRAVETPPPLWMAFNKILKHSAYLALFGGLAFVLILVGRTRAWLPAWLEAARTVRWGRWLLANLALFVLVLATLPIFYTQATSPPWAAFLLWLGCCAATFAAGALAIAPKSAWLLLLKAKPIEYAMALAGGALLYASQELARDSWSALSVVTLHAAHALLSLYESNLVFDPSRALIGAGDFEVLILSACSGYEGIGLVLTALSLFMFAFRRDFRFPDVLILLPIGALMIWCLNVVRIAMLISIGAHVSPDIALNGFHSQAGWVMFLAASVGLMLVAHGHFAREKAVKKSVEPALLLAAALLLPFAALMGGRIVAGVLGESAYWAGVLATLAPLPLLLVFWRRLTPLFQHMRLEPVLIGLALGLAWAATEPAHTESALGAWLQGQPGGQAGFWVLLRLLGFMLIVPLVEELAFRGYLHRALAGPRFELTTPAAFSWTAFLVTSLLFGAMHGRWLAGALAGAVFALCLYRSKSLTGPFLAHAAANGAIAAWAIAADDWALI